MSLSEAPRRPRFEYTFIKRAHALFTSLVTLAAALLFLIPGFAIPPGFLAVCILSSAFHALLYLFFDRLSTRVFTAANVLNLIMMVAAVHFTGGILSPFTMVFALVLISGAGYGVRMSLALAVAVGAYAGLVLAEKTGVLTPIALSSPDLYRSWPATLFVLFSVAGFMASTKSIYDRTVETLRIKIALELEIKQSMANRVARLDSSSQIALLFGKIVSDIQAPLDTVHTYLRALRSDASMSAERREDCGLMLREADRMRGILVRMASYARVEDSGREPLCLRDVVESALFVASFVAGASGIAVQKELPDSGELVVYANKQELNQVFFNILKNAIESCPPEWPKRTIRVAAARRDGLAVVRIIDSGCGIARHVLSGLGTEIVSTKPRAAGIGIIVAREIIQMYKGALNFHSIEGGGTTVVVSLPLHRTVSPNATQEDHVPLPQT